MLTDEERIAFHKSIAGVRHLAAKSLAQASDVGRAIEFVANLHRSLDSVALHASKIGPVPDCKLGCSYCCHIRVEATDPEIFGIARRIRQRPEAEVADLIEKLRRHATERNVGGGATRQSCAFLVDARCAIYEVRPATCRKAHSLSVKQCETLSPEIPQNLKLLVEADAMMAGTAEAYRDRKLQAAAHELNAAVLAALNDQSAEARWYNGEDVFCCSGQLAPD
jgi:Fe-S-cluster containining protein